MNKQEAIEKINELRQKFAISLSRRNGKSYCLKKDVLVANKQDVIDIINQIEPEKPVVPQFVADWYEENKDDFEGNLFRCVDNIPLTFEGTKLNEFEKWLLNASTKSFQILVNMHQFGYEVEKEKLYTARLKVVTIKKAGYLNRHNKNGSITIDTSYTAGGQYQVYFTRSELEELGIWNNPAFEIEEVE